VVTSDLWIGNSRTLSFLRTRSYSPGTIPLLWLLVRRRTTVNSPLQQTGVDLFSA
jgi:hypothetical protein